MKLTSTVLVIILILLILVPPALSSVRADQTAAVPTRTVPLTIQLVLIGFDSHTIDRDYLTWKGNVVQNSVNNVLSTGNITGIYYELTYNFIYTTPEFQQKLTKFLKSIQVKKLLYNPWFRATTQNFLYNASTVEDWLLANNADYGGFPTHGYTFVIANLTGLPSVTERQLLTDNPMNATPHYYRTQYVDKDLDYRIRYRDFSVAWGGRSRLWFIDMAAGPEYWTWSNSESVPHIPMQIALDLFKLNVHTLYGKQWLTQFLADYMYDAVLNLAVPVFTYQPVYSRTYRIVLNVIDNRTQSEKEQVPIEKTIHPKLVRQAFQELLPYSEIQMETKLISARDVPSLQAAIIENTVTPPSNLAIGRYVDARPIYRYLQQHLTEFVGSVRRDSTEFTLPVFTFAFSSGIYFGFTYKWYVATLKVDENSFLGVSLGDMALLGMTQDEFRKGDNVNPPQPGKGIGFTQAVIHEAGHSLGLMHPHQFGYLQDFESSAMSYWSWEYMFSQFDEDAINRAHADQLILKAESQLGDAQNTLNGRFDLGPATVKITLANALLAAALSKYDSMQYVEAVRIAAQAAEAASSALADALAAPNGVVAASLVSLILGIVIGSTLILFAFRKYSSELPEGR